MDGRLEHRDWFDHDDDFDLDSHVQFMYWSNEEREEMEIYVAGDIEEEEGAELDVDEAVEEELWEIHIEEAVGITDPPLEAYILMGPIYYQKLKYEFLIDFLGRLNRDCQLRPRNFSIIDELYSTNDAFYLKAMRERLDFICIDVGSESSGLAITISDREGEEMEIYIAGDVEEEEEADLDADEAVEEEVGEIHVKEAVSDELPTSGGDE
ncbi:hypothetical protein Q3G72_025372 [Acer saccharum]|nr:hypothetical protein Q3G72_025372 [Acer saccharum]